MTETQSTDAVETATPKFEGDYAGANPMGLAMLPKLAALAEKHNVCKGKLAKSSAGSLDKARRDWVKDSENDEIVKLRRAVEQAQARMMSLAKEALPDPTDSVDEDSVKEEIKELRNEFRTVRKTLVDAINFGAGPILEDAQEVIERANAIELKGASASGSNTGVSRPRVMVSVENLGNFESISKAAFKMKGVSGGDIRKAYAAKVGVDESKLSDFNNATTSFEVKGWKVTTSPKTESASDDTSDDDATEDAA